MLCSLSRTRVRMRTHWHGCPWVQLDLPGSEGTCIPHSCPERGTFRWPIYAETQRWRGPVFWLLCRLRGLTHWFVAEHPLHMGRPWLTACVWKSRRIKVKLSLKKGRCSLRTKSTLSPFSQFSSVAQSCLTLQPHGLQHTRPPCPSPTPRAYSNSCPLSRWCHPTISSSVVPFSSCLQSFPASGSFLMSWLFSSGGQSIGVSASASVLPMNIQDWFPLDWTGWISLQSKRLWRVFPTPQFKSISSSVLSFLYSPILTSIHDYWKNHSFD